MKTPTKLTGTTAECLADFFSRFGKSRTLMEVAQIAESAERSWRKRQNLPTGEALIRVRFFLSECGYGVRELLSVPSPLTEIAGCISLNCISIQKVAERLSISEASQFFGYFRGVTPSLQRVDILNNIWAECRGEFLKREAILRNTLVDEKILPAGTSLKGGFGSGDIIGDFAMACKEIVELGKPLLEGSREQRFAMRQRIGSGTSPLMHSAWATLNQLLKEKS